MSSYVPCKKNDSNGYIFYISLISQANGKIFQANPTLTAGDIQVAIDDGSPANVSAMAVDGDFTKRVKITLSQAQTNGDNITILCSDAAGDEWCDLIINIQTSAQTLDEIDTVVDGIQTQVDTTGVALLPGAVDDIWDEQLTGAAHNTATSAGRRLRTAGHDEEIMREDTCQAGEDASHVKLDEGASAANNFYDHSWILLKTGTGAGQVRVIDDYVGSSKVGEVHPNWLTNPAGDSTFIIFARAQVYAHDIGAEGTASIQAEIEENGASVLDTIRDAIANGTYGLSAIRTRGDIAWITGGGGDATAANQLLLIKILTNKWEVKDNQLIMYDDDGTTPLYTFDLSRDGTPSEFNPDLRSPV